MICRLWNGWTAAGNADAYEALLLTEVFPWIAAKGIAGYREIQLFRRPLPSGDVEFTTAMWFDSLDAVKAFAGDDYDRAVVPERARALLSRWDERSRHLEVVDRRLYPPY